MREDDAKCRWNVMVIMKDDKSSNEERKREGKKRKLKLKKNWRGRRKEKKTLKEWRKKFIRKKYKCQITCNLATHQTK